MDNIFHIFKFVLPVELIQFIIPYTYEPQSNALTDDIQSFHTTKPIIHLLYYNIYVIEFDEPEPSDKEWLINDLFGFSNQNGKSLGISVLGASFCTGACALKVNTLPAPT